MCPALLAHSLARSDSGAGDATTLGNVTPTQHAPVSTQTIPGAPPRKMDDGDGDGFSELSTSAASAHSHAAMMLSSLPSAERNRDLERASMGRSLRRVSLARACST